MVVQTFLKQIKLESNILVEAYHFCFQGHFSLKLFLNSLHQPQSWTEYINTFIYQFTLKARLHYTRFLVRHGYKWYGCQKVEFSSFIYTSIFSRANNFISAFGTRTKPKCSFRIRSAESLLPSTHASSVVSKWRMESFWKTFSSISLKGGDSRTEN